MALFLLYADYDHRNSTGIHSVLVDAASESAARTAAAAATPAGVVDIDRWAAESVATSPTLPDGRTLIWFEGMCSSLLGRSRGGAAMEVQ